MEVVRQLNPTVSEYNGRFGTPNGERVVSFDADELRQIVPQAVTRVMAEDRGEKSEIDGINTHEVFFHLLRAVQQIDKRLQRLEEKL